MSTMIEYAVLGLGIVCTTALLILGKIQPSDGLPIITTCIGYAVGASRVKVLTNTQASQIASTLKELNSPKG